MEPQPDTNGNVDELAALYFIADARTAISAKDYGQAIDSLNAAVQHLLTLKCQGLTTTKNRGQLSLR